MSGDARGNGNAGAAGAGGSETTSAGPAPKRMRVSRACEQCRSRKAKCDGKTPTCSPCVTLSQQCTYGAQPRKRGLPPGSVSALERTVKLLQRVLGLLIVSVEGSEHALLGLVQRCGKNLFDDGDEGKKLSSAWKDGLLPEALELLREKTNGTDASERSPTAATEVGGTQSGAVGAGGKNAAPLAIDLGLAQEHFQEAIRAISSGVDGPGGAALEGDVTRRTENSRDRDNDEGVGPTEMDWVKDSQSLQESERDKDNARSRESPNSIPQLPPNTDGSLTNSIDHSYQNRMRPPAVVTPPLFTSIDNSDENPFPEPVPNLSMPDQPMHDSVIPNQTFRPISYQQSIPNESPVRDNFIIPPREKDYPQLPPNSRLLLDLYFAYTHVWFPVLDKYDLIRFFHIVNSSSSSKRKANPPKTEVPSGKRALLYAVLALATIQNDGLSRAAPAEGASSQQFPYTPPPISSSPPASALYTAAQQLIFRPGEEYSLEHVQALLLLSLVNIMLSHLNCSWLLIGHAGRVAVDIGLKSETKSRFNTRTWLGYLVLETFISVRLGRYPQVREEDWAVPAVEEDGWEEWDSWKEVPAADPRGKRDVGIDDHGGQDHNDPAHILSVFNQLARLSRVMRRVASITPPKQSPEHNHKHEHRGEERIPPPQNILHQLHSWCRDLLPHCSFDILNPMEVELPTLVPTAPHISNLHLFYAHAILELYNRSRSFHDYGPNSQNPVLPSASAAASSTATILEHVRSTRSLAVVPCTFIHFVGMIPSGSPGTGNDEIGPFTPMEKSVPERSRILRDELKQYRHKATTGFLPGKGLLKMTTEITQRKKQDVLLERPPPPRQIADPRPRLMSEDSTFGGQLAAMSPSRLFHTFIPAASMISPPGNIPANAGSDANGHFRRPSFPVSTGIDPISQMPSSNVSTLQGMNMRTGPQQQDDDNSVSGNMNNAYNRPGSGSQAASLSLSQTQTAPSPDGFDEEMGMLECLPWTQNGIPEFIQNLGYVGGFSPSAFQLGHSGHDHPPEQAPLQILGLRQEGTGTHTDEGGGGGYDGGGGEGGPPGGGGSAGDDTNTMSGRRGLNTVLEQWLGDVLGAGGNNRWP